MPNLPGIIYPIPNVTTGWGDTLNDNTTIIDNVFAAAGTGTSVGLQVGTGKTLGIGGTLILGGGDGTGTTTAPTIRGPNRTGVSNAVGSNLTIDAGNGTGSGGSGSITLRTASPGTGGGGTNPNVFQNSLLITGKTHQRHHQQGNFQTLGVSGCGQERREEKLLHRQHRFLLLPQ